MATTPTEDSIEESDAAGHRPSLRESVGVAARDRSEVRWTHLQPHILEQPWDALRPRFVQVVHHDHHGTAFAVGRGDVAELTGGVRRSCGEASSGRLRTR